MIKLKSIAAAITLSLLAGASFAGGHAESWTVDTELSAVSFGSVKNDYTGESHTISDVTGTVDANGVVSITLGLASVETMIDIRNERMREIVFANAPTATISAQLDMAEISALASGDAKTVETSGTLSLLGTDTDLDASFFVMRLSEDQVLVTTNGMMMLSIEDTAFNASIDKMQELASLDSITRVSPVTMRLLFKADH
ncbi:YceI family protein [Sulfitobacter donghicola]|uniref:Lipid/polyisoprenoid-binding YceI-like domain-containing protein n=1 Tax=Sulfitobacter donghicola DSW-25 = KCTC 12864 = JCM 14565 TaxID=1300350 RepID=A0A073IEL3_9RHOB|nr:YceI family protein [Sulfitobacter donghicola]KEJ88189.1 hypothetical protein DSW25_16065 [Sulfitobacter donghicola DSW-25 = KCTC 12864 = JCM 14565]KIN68780.1 YceI family protein [Sulfitobacter donghicola DSW-25 = KCTC 12864 = JCM 14565]